MSEKKEVPQFIEAGVDHLLDRTKQKILKGFSGLEVEDQLKQLSLVVQLSESFREKIDALTQKIESGEMDRTPAPPATGREESKAPKPESRGELALKLISGSKITGEIFKEVMVFIAASRKLTMNELAASIPVGNSYLYTFFTKEASFSTKKGKQLIKWARAQVKEIIKSK